MNEPDSLRIRPALPGDARRVLELLAQPDMADGDVPSQQDAEKILAATRSDPNHTVYVAETGGAVVGTFALFVMQHLSHRGRQSAVVEDVVVEANRQGRGIGREMMHFAAERAREQNCYKIVLSSGAGREQSHRFYEKLGYEKHGHSFLLDLNKKEAA